MLENLRRFSSRILKDLTTTDKTVLSMLTIGVAVCTDTRQDATAVSESVSTLERLIKENISSLLLNKIESQDGELLTLVKGLLDDTLSSFIYVKTTQSIGGLLLLQIQIDCLAMQFLRQALIVVWGVDLINNTMDDIARPCISILHQHLESLKNVFLNVRSVSGVSLVNEDVLEFIGSHVTKTLVDDAKALRSTLFTKSNSKLDEMLSIMEMLKKGGSYE